MFVNLRVLDGVALRKESVDRNINHSLNLPSKPIVALRKESVDRNTEQSFQRAVLREVALRKESVDRNSIFDFLNLSNVVALRKESVDRNFYYANKDADWVRRSPQGERG